MRRFVFRPGVGFYWVMEWLTGTYQNPGPVSHLWVGPFGSLDAAWNARAGRSA